VDWRKAWVGFIAAVAGTFESANAAPRFEAIAEHDHFLSCDDVLDGAVVPDGIARLWMRDRADPVLELGRTGCQGLSFSLDGKRFLAGRTVFEASGRVLRVLPTQTSEGLSFATALSLDGETAYLASQQWIPGTMWKQVILSALHVDSGEARWSVMLPADRLLTPAIVPLRGRDGETLVVGTGDRVFSVDAQNGRRIQTLAAPYPSAPQPLPDRRGAAVALGTASNTVQFVGIDALSGRIEPVASWQLEGNVLPLHTRDARGRWWIPAGRRLVAHGVGLECTVEIPSSEQPEAVAVSVLALSDEAFVVGWSNGAVTQLRGGCTSDDSLAPRLNVHPERQSR
jgi:hypothetical protein